MLSMRVFGNDLAVLQGFAVLGGRAPGSKDLESHKTYIEKNGYDKWVAALNDLFSNVSDADLAKALAVNTGLNKVKLNGDADPENIQLATDFIAANASNRIGAILDFVKAFSKLTTGEFQNYASSFNARIEAAYDYANGHETTWRDFNKVEYNLTTGKDTILGTAADDYFNGWYNTFNDGDELNGGSGNDTLNADVYSGGPSGDKEAFTAVTKGIENIILRSQYKLNSDENDNNLLNTTIDAERMQGVLNWESNNSRADLLIEDVRILDNQITKDITITMRDTMPGHVDYGVYFDQNSLRNKTDSQSQINVRVLDTYAVAEGRAQLHDSPYGSFTFYVAESGSTDFKKIELTNQEMKDAKTLAEMATAMQKAADAALGLGAATVSLGNSYTVVDSVTGKTVAGQEIIIKGQGNYTFNTSLSGAGWLPYKTVPSTSGLYTSYNTDVQTDTALVTSKVVLDYVGRSSTGGDLVIGGVSIGDTSTSKGVQRFEIEVQDDSRLRKISSTNDSLQEVTIVNGKTDRVNDAYTTLEKDAGTLVVKGEMSPNTPSTDTQNKVLPGGSNSEYGFQDVRLIDGSAMTGKLDFNAEITQNAVKKYLNLKDTQANPLAENVKVEYTGGSNNDSMWVNINEVAVASNSKVNPGKADFSFSFAGNSGNDKINVAIDRVIDAAKVTAGHRGVSSVKTDLTGFDVVQTGDTDILLGNTENWYHNHRSNGRDKIVVFGNAGDDTLVKAGAGDITIDAGTGADTVYADNTGAVTHAVLDTKTGAVENVITKAMWGFGTTGNLQATNPGYEAAGLNVGNAKSAQQFTVGSWGVEVQVNFRGLLSQWIKIDDLADYQATQLDINQAIKNAINNDIVLNKLLVASDGPGVSLVVQSKVDATHDAAALTINLRGPNAAQISDEALAGYKLANNKAATFDKTAMAAEIAARVLNKGYVAGSESLGEGYNTKMAQDNGGADIVGAPSITTSDNLIYPGVDLDTDVIVLGTTAGTNELASSNDIVRFEGLFGRDVIVNFNTGIADVGGDRIDFTAVGGRGSLLQGWKGGGAVAETVTNGQIERVAYDDTNPERNDSMEAVKALYAASDAVTRTAKATELYVAVHSDGTGDVYQVVDGTAAGDLTVTLLGHLNVSGDPTSGSPFNWSTAVAHNFAG